MERLYKRFNKYQKLLRDALRSILVHKLRSALSILGVICGVMAVLTMIAIGEGARHELIRRIEQLGTKNIYIKALPLTEVQEKDAVEKLSRGLSLYDRDRILNGCDYVKDIACVKEVQADILGTNDGVSPQIIACTPNYAEIYGIQPVHGRFFKPSDIEGEELVCIVGDNVVKKVDGRRGIGAYVRVGHHMLKVVGILDRVDWNPDKNAVISVRNYNEMVFIPLGLDQLFVQNASDKSAFQRETLSELIIHIKDAGHVSEAAEIINRILEVAHNGVGDYQVVIPKELLMEAQKTQRTFNLVLAAIGGISLLVGGIGVMNVMLASVSERTREIGIRRSVGATRQDIIVQFLVEAMFLTFSGGVAGVLIGTVFVYAVSFMASWPMMINSWSVAVPLLLSIMVGIFFGLFPAVKASAMEPITALRYE